LRQAQASSQQQLVSSSGAAWEWRAGLTRTFPHFCLTPLNAATQSCGMVSPNPWMILPFLLLLGAIASGPVLAPGWWLRHYAKVALSLGALTSGYYILILRDPHSLGHTAQEYVSFIALVGSLYIVSGGIHIGVKGEATPFKNVIFLLTGAVVANLLGTTGAAMLLIRP
jgi:Na+/H+ antiporter NhaD/arsenite permease-like protein